MSGACFAAACHLVATGPDDASPPHPFTPAKLSLTHRDTEVSIGGFLNIEDTEKLIGMLEKNGLLIERKEPDPQIGLWF